ncbi:MAG: thermonuclease [Aquificota bacterium]|nr:MAG: thermonuclease [Aquificota bacterium]
MKKNKYILVVLLLIFNISFSVELPSLFKKNEKIKPDFVKAKVVKVIDGDTIVVKIPKTTFNDRKTLKNLKFRVRLIGIDTPESRVNRRAKIQSKETGEKVKKIVKLGKIAKEFTKKLLPKGKAIFLEFDVEPQDKYGRLLAYIWLPDGKMVNKEIICNGFAFPLTVPPNVKYEKEFLKCFKKARKERKGLWRIK